MLSVNLMMRRLADNDGAASCSPNFSHLSWCTYLFPGACAQFYHNYRFGMPLPCVAALESFSWIIPHVVQVQIYTFFVTMDYGQMYIRLNDKNTSVGLSSLLWTCVILDTYIACQANVQFTTHRAYILFEMQVRCVCVVLCSVWCCVNVMFLKDLLTLYLKTKFEQSKNQKRLGKGFGPRHPNSPNLLRSAD